MSLQEVEQTEIETNKQTAHPCSPCSSYSEHDLQTGYDGLLSDTSSIFGDEECGEPERPQHLLLDFTPGVEDDDFLQQKVCAFWEFVRSNPEFFDTELKSDSEEEDYEYENNQKTHEQTEPHTIERSAISALKIAKDNHALDNILNADVCHSMCSLGSREYIETEPDNRTAPVVAPGHSSYAVQAMCRSFDKWNLEHPKSMEHPRNISDFEMKSLE